MAVGARGGVPPGRIVVVRRLAPQAVDLVALLEQMAWALMGADVRALTVLRWPVPREAMVVALVAMVITP